MFLQGASHRALLVLLCKIFTDTIPSPLPLCEALQRREAKEKEILEADPAMSSWAPGQLPNSVHGNYSSASKGKGKARAVNGKEKSDGDGIKRERRSREFNGRWSYTNGDGGENTGTDGIEVTWPPCTWPDEQPPFRPTSHPPAQNGADSISVGYAREGDLEAIRPPGGRTVASAARPLDDPMEFFPSVSYSGQQTAFSAQGEAWPGQYTGPASGFLHPHGSFVRIGPNPGRTIYSQQQSTDSSSFR
jgi:hypothetical protein